MQFIKSLKIGYIALIFFLLLAGLAIPAHAAMKWTNPASCPSTLPQGTVLTPYADYTYVVSGGGATPTFAVTSGSLPLNLTLSSLGVLSGTPATGSQGTYLFTVTATKQQGGETLMCNCTLVIVAESTMSCSFVGGVNTGAISFGTSIDPMAAGPVTGTVNIPVQFTCTRNNPYIISVNPASGWQLTSGSNTIPYTLGVISSGTYGGTALNVFTTGSSMTQSQYGNAPTGGYANTSTINVNISWTGGGPITATLLIGSVTGTISKTCSASSNGVINFGTLDAVANSGGVAASEALVTTKPTIYCTAGSTYMVTATGANGGTSSGGTSSGYQLNYGTNHIPYTFTYTTPITGSGYATPIGGSGSNHLAITPSIAAGALNSAQAGTYGDTITLTIAY